MALNTEVVSFVLGAYGELHLYPAGSPESWEGHFLKITLPLSHSLVDHISDSFSEEAMQGECLLSAEAVNLESFAHPWCQVGCRRLHKTVQFHTVY